MLAAFAQVQSLTEALNDYIQIPILQPTDMLVKSASLCDDCFKSAEQQCQEQQSKSIQPLTSSPSTHSQSPSTSTSTSTSTVINNNLTESTTSIEMVILADDDGYCEIDEIRLPAIKKTPSMKITDPRRQSAPAPLPPDANEDDEQADSANDATPDKSANNHDIPSAEPALNNSNASASKPDSKHAEGNSLSQPMSELKLSSESKTKLKNGSTKSTCDNLCPIESSFAGTQYAVPSVPCHVISAYVASLNLHISQLLVSRCVILEFSTI